MIYDLTVTANPSLNGRSSPSSSSTSNIIFPNGFKYGDIVTASSVYDNAGVLWYGIYECIRNGTLIILPAPIVWAASRYGETIYLRLDGTTPDPQPPADIFPTEIWLSMTENGEKRKYVLVV